MTNVRLSSAVRPSNMKRPPRRHMMRRPLPHRLLEDAPAAESDAALGHGHADAASCAATLNSGGAALHGAAKVDARHPRSAARRLRLCASKVIQNMGTLNT